MNIKPITSLVSVALALAMSAAAQSDMKESAVPTSSQASEAQRTFATMKGLAGDWDGSVTLDPPQPAMSDGKSLHVSMRVTSRGNALVHEMQETGTPLDPKKYDHPLTMLYLDGDRLTLVHYCDAGNRPRMVARTSADGKTVEFDFLDLSGGDQYGHMYHAVFTTVDANHHTEDWTYLMPGDKPFRAHVDLQRTK